MAEQILELFPLHDQQPGQKEDKPSDEDLLQKLREIQSTLIWQKPLHEDDLISKESLRAGHLYKRYRTIQQLPEVARVFYEKAGKLFCNSYRISDMIQDVKL